VLAVRSPHLADEHWLALADRAVAAGEGRFELQGRADRIVKIEEKRVSLTALEAALLATGLLKEARGLVLDAADSSTAQATQHRPHLAVVAVPHDAGWALHDTQGKRGLNESLRTALLQNVERVALPRRWRYVRELPQNAQGKTTQADLAALFDDAPPTRTLPPLRWLQRDAGAGVLALDVRADLTAFDGHFDGAPILPGVAQLDWAARLGRECRLSSQTEGDGGLAANFIRVEVLKFQQPILPGMQVELHLRWSTRPGSGESEGQDNHALDFSYRGAASTESTDSTNSGEAVIHSSGRLVYAPPRKDA